ncbi:MAG: hypothetical protein CL662_00875 [Bacteroidetes bacterium]|nr:hypothetical protein [Bacteroidota bacterium]
MNLSNFFSLFSNNDKPEDNKEQFTPTHNTFEDLMNTPAYWVGMFKKLIYNYKSHGNKMLMQVEGFDIAMDYEDVQRAYEFMLFERSYFYLTCLDINNPEDLKVLENESDKILLFSINTCISYYEDCEEYEKCSYLKGILDLSKDFCEKA